MATRDTTTDERRFETSQPTMARREETKASFLTTEFWAMLGVIAAVLVAAQQADNFDAPRAWTLVAAVAIGYRSAEASRRAAATIATETATGRSNRAERQPRAVLGRSSDLSDGQESE